MILNLDKNLMTLKGESTSKKLSHVLVNVLAQMITWAVNLTNTGRMEVKLSSLFNWSKKAII